MPTFNKPGTLPQWASDSSGNATALATVVPTGLKQTAGWATGEKPPAQYMNWWMWLVFTWVLYLSDLQEQFFDSSSGGVGPWTGHHNFTNTIDVSSQTANLYGTKSTGKGTGPGVWGVGDTTSGALGAGVKGTAGGNTGDNVPGVDGYGGLGFGPGVQGTGGTGSTGGPGVVGNGTQNGPGVIGTGGPGSGGGGGAGVSGQGQPGGIFAGVAQSGAPDAGGVKATSVGAGHGVEGDAAGTGYGGYFNSMGNNAVTGISEGGTSTYGGAFINLFGAGNGVLGVGGNTGGLGTGGLFAGGGQTPPTPNGAGVQAVGAAGSSGGEFTGTGAGVGLKAFGGASAALGAFFFPGTGGKKAAGFGGRIVFTFGSDPTPTEDPGQDTYAGVHFVKAWAFVSIVGGTLTWFGVGFASITAAAQGLVCTLARAMVDTNYAATATGDIYTISGNPTTFNCFPTVWGKTTGGAGLQKATNQFCVNLNIQDPAGPTTLGNPTGNITTTVNIHVTGRQT